MHISNTSDETIRKATQFYFNKFKTLSELIAEYDKMSPSTKNSEIFKDEYRKAYIRLLN